MHTRPRLSAFCCAALLILRPTLAADDVLRVCADEWMPFNGAPGDERPGYVVELIQAVFEPKGVKFEYSSMPWEESLAAVREGRMGATIGANEVEGEGMILPAEPIGAPPICLMTRADSTWSYDNIVSFRSVRLGVIKDYSYWPNLDAYIGKKAGSGVVVVEGDAPLGELMRLLLEGKVDVIAESEPVLLWHLRANNLERAQFRVVYKHEPEPIYVAFAPTEDGKRYAALFDAGVKELRTSGELETLLRRYGLRDWQ